ncbi:MULTISPECIES: ATP-binding protein [unclassified Bradyrhizobium]|uniref:ATP-binding protein n=1 Tax=unclassified Bradyrhizobium TaxID=2631580 RepID=UPI001FEEA56C|nr:MULTISPECIES: ATP-binding protein [unclassified Bradyrhizobium]WFU77139.1 ATP-binding protein [Bradyrhizobium sp. CB2312]
MASCPRAEVAVDRFTVANKGPGISADIADRLLQPFVTTKRHGMGVGLSICRTTIESWQPYRRASKSGWQRDPSVHRAICRA